MSTRGEGMRAAEVGREAVRNLRAGVGGSPWLAVVLVLAASVAVIAPQWALLDGDARAREYRDAGAATLIVQDSGRIDGARCESYLSLPNVMAAGAIREVIDGVRLDLLPSTSVRYFETTPQFAGVLGAEPEGAGVMLSADVADAVGASSGGSMLLGDSHVPVASVFDYPNDGRVTGLGFAITGDVPAGSGLFDECWITVWPQTTDIEGLASYLTVPGGSADSQSELRLQQANSSLGVQFTIGPSRQVWEYAAPVGMAAAALAALVFVRVRRLELASARHVGVRVADQAAVLVTEAISVSVVAVAVVAPVVAYLTVAVQPEAAASLGWYALRGAVAVLVGALLGALIGLAGVRERHLFRYFRER